MSKRASKRLSRPRSEKEVCALFEPGTSSTILWHLAITIGLGLLVGFERERAGKEVGLRTFSFTALLGYLTWNLGHPYALTGLALLGVMVIVINASALRAGSGVEATTSVALFLIYVVGMLVAQGQLFIPVSVVILMLALLSWKEEMVTFSKHLKRSEIHAAITLALLSFVILPVLPDAPVDPWGLLNARRVWLMVVLISSIGFANYILLKLYGARGITFTGFFGGLVNSTATAMEMAQKARDGDPAIEEFAFRGVMWAKTAAFLRNAVILGIFAPSALPGGILPIGLMLAVSLYYALRGARRAAIEPPELVLESPFSLKAALQFGLLFAIITAVGNVAQTVLGVFGFYAVSFAGGMISSSSTAATAANFVMLGQITPVEAGASVVISSIASALVILPLVWRTAGKSLGRRVAKTILIMMVVTAIGIAINPFFVKQYSAVTSWLHG